MVLHTVWLRTANCVVLSNILGLVLGLFHLKRTTACSHLEHGVLDRNPPHLMRDLTMQHQLLSFSVLNLDSACILHWSAYSACRQ